MADIDDDFYPGWEDVYDFDDPLDDFAKARDALRDAIVDVFTPVLDWLAEKLDAQRRKKGDSNGHD